MARHDRSPRRGQVQSILADALGAVTAVGLVAAVLVFRPGPASTPSQRRLERPDSPAGSFEISAGPLDK